MRRSELVRRRHADIGATFLPILQARRFYGADPGSARARGFVRADTRLRLRGHAASSARTRGFVCADTRLRPRAHAASSTRAPSGRTSTPSSGTLGALQKVPAEAPQAERSCEPNSILGLALKPSPRVGTADEAVMYSSRSFFWSGEHFFLDASGAAPRARRATGRGDGPCGAQERVWRLPGAQTPREAIPQAIGRGRGQSVRRDPRW